MQLSQNLINPYKMYYNILTAIQGILIFSFIPLLIFFIIRFKKQKIKSEPEINLGELKWYQVYKDVQDPNPEKIPEWYPGSDYQELFNHMLEEHDLILLQGEMDEIINISGRFLDKNPIQNISRKF